MTASLDALAPPLPTVATPRRRRWSPLWRDVLYGVPIMACLLFLFIGSEYLADMATAPGDLAHALGGDRASFDVIGAGYLVCGDLARGVDPDDVIAAATRDGIGGHRYSAVEIARLVVTAPQTICTEVTS